MAKEKSEAVLGHYREIVWKEISKYLKDPEFPQSFRVPQKYNKEVNLHWKITKEYPERKGKYLRPTLVILTLEAMGGKRQKGLKTAAAMQVSEEWILIHDDFQDHSLKRRGAPTLHEIYGPELAMNAGDTLQIIMWKILSDNCKILGWKKAVELQEEFYKMLMRTTLGQMVEVAWVRENKFKTTDNDWFFVADSKSAYYSIAGPMRLGAIVAGASPKELEALSKFGLYLGRCYQLVDDILDLTSDFRGLKKQQGNDIYEGKKTVMLGHLIRTSNQKNRKRLVAIFSKPREKKTKAEVEWVMERMNHYGSIEYGRGVAEKLKRKAWKIFQKELMFLSKQPYRDKIEGLIHFVLEREY